MEKAVSVRGRRCLYGGFAVGVISRRSGLPVVEVLWAAAAPAGPISIEIRQR